MNRPSPTSISVVATVLAVVSLGLNAYLILQVREAERMLAPARSLLEQMTSEEGRMSTDVRLPAGTPINLDIPVDERFTIRVDTVLPINARVTIPLRTPVGNYQVPVPIRASVPLRTNLPLRLQHTFRLRTETSEEIRIPIVVGQ